MSNDPLKKLMSEVTLHYARDMVRQQECALAKFISENPDATEVTLVCWAYRGRVIAVVADSEEYDDQAKTVPHPDALFLACHTYPIPTIN